MRTMSLLTWKNSKHVEMEQHTFFTKQFGTAGSKRSLHDTMIYYCQQDGSSAAHVKSGDPARLTDRRNKKGRVKTDNVCPAKMNVKVTEEKVTVKFTTTHSHAIRPQDIQHQPIPSSQVENIKNRLSIGVPPETIIKDLREGHGSRESRDQEFHIKKTHFISKLQVSKIACKLKISRRLHPDDATSVYMMVQQLMQEKYDGVLMHKPENGNVVKGLPNWLTDSPLFVLGHMTKEQEEQLKKNAYQIVCIDSTHETNQYKFKLVTVLVPDEFHKGYPVAHLITNREDTEVLIAFFTTIKDRVGNIDVNTLMTDDDNVG